MQAWFSRFCYCYFAQVDNCVCLLTMVSLKSKLYFFVDGYCPGSSSSSISVEVHRDQINTVPVSKND